MNNCKLTFAPLCFMRLTTELPNTDRTESRNQTIQQRELEILITDKNKSLNKFKEIKNIQSIFSAHMELN